MKAKVTPFKIEYYLVMFYTALCIVAYYFKSFVFDILVCSFSFGLIFSLFYLQRKKNDNLPKLMPFIANKAKTLLIISMLLIVFQEDKVQYMVIANTLSVVFMVSFIALALIAYLKYDNSKFSRNCYFYLGLWAFFFLNFFYLS